MMTLKVKQRNRVEPYYENKNGKLYHGDCLDIMPGLETVDMVLTDPPYGTTSCEWDIVTPFAPMWEQLKRIIKPNGAIVMTASQPFTTALVGSNIEMFGYEIIWEKERPSNIFLMRKQVGKSHENVLVFYRAQPTFNPQVSKSEKKRTRATMQKYVGNSLKHHDGKSVTSYRDDWDGSVCLPRSVVYFVRDVGKENHPTQKPVALMEYLIRTYTNKGDTVLDFVMGSGTTGVACVNLKREFIGIELDDKYFELAEKRIKDASTQMIMDLE